MRKLHLLTMTGRILLLMALFVTGVQAMPPWMGYQVDDENYLSGPELSPEPTTIDRITQNKGNLVTTIDNWALVGGYPNTLPSGEWPRNSGHNYLAEIRYWMGAVAPNGDTLLANTGDDFQAIPMPVNGYDAYKIYLSTDTLRYYDYSLDDTVGLATGNPAYGWRVWDPQLDSWDYNTSYNSLSADYREGGPTSLQDSHYRFNDAAGGTSLMGLELTHTAMEWNYCYNEDIMFVVIDITNTSAVDYVEFAFGLYADMDVGGLDGLGGNGNQNDVVVYDTADNWAYTYDVVGIDPGWGPTVQTGIMGTKMLETPGNVGVTALRTDDWSYLPDNDAGRFAMINSAQFDTPLPPTDQFYIQCVRGAYLAAGATVRVVYALIGAADSLEFVANAAMAQQLYDNNFVGPQPPPTPTVSVRASDRKVYVSWDSEAEEGMDPLTGTNDFVGYKLYRSDNQGKTWGVVNYRTNNSCLEFDYVPVAQYTVNEPGDPIPHSFIDTGLYNGVEYWYCLAAFDRGDSTIDPLQSGYGIAGTAENVVAARPVREPAGYYDAAATVQHNYFGDFLPSDGQVVPILFDPSAAGSDEYRVVFEDTPARTYWHLLNYSTGDTLLAHQTRYDGVATYYEIVEGVKAIVTGPEVEPRGYSQTVVAGSSVSLEIDHFYGPAISYWTGNAVHAFGYGKYRANYEIRYTGDSSLAWSMWEYFDGTTYPLTLVPFEIWNMATNQRVSVALDEWPVDQLWQPGDGFIIVDYPYNPDSNLTEVAFPYEYGWKFSLNPAVYTPTVGDVLTIEGAPLSGPDDVFVFRLDGVDAAEASDDLNNIKVVPNPYFVKYSSMVETEPGESVLYFNNIPDICTIRIYTLSGDLVRTIEHTDGTGAQTWDLLSSNHQLVASGIYLYHVDSEYGEFLGRFAVIK